MSDLPEISCFGKVKHETKIDALKAINRRGCKKKSDTLKMVIKPYKCKWCGFWHVGHTQRSVKEGRNERSV